MRSFEAVVDASRDLTPSLAARKSFDPERVATDDEARRADLGVYLRVF